jgi:hypothetical protein
MEQEILNKKIQEAGFKIWYEYNSISQSNPNSLCPIGFVLEKI